MDEFTVIERYFLNQGTIAQEGVSTGPGDDCAVFAVPPDQELCVSTDTLLEDVHFPSGAPASVVAYRSFGANLSDLAAMGATPYGVTMALTLPGVDEVWLQEFSATVAAICDEYGLQLLGGNLARGALSLTLNIMGVIPLGQALLRSGARAGDEVFVSGEPGCAAAGLAMLQRGDERFPGLVDRYCRPVPRIALGQALLGIASACIDVSDGLAADLGHLCRQSAVSARVDRGQLPVAPDLLAAVPDEAQALILSGGDDYELCFTAPAGYRDQLRTVANDTGVRITRIGTLVAGEGVFDLTGNPLDTAGYRHF